MSDSILPSLQQLETKLSELESCLSVLSDPALADSGKNLDILDQCQLDVLLTLAANTLLWSSMELSGTASKNHPVVSQLERSRTYIQKVKEASGSDKPKVKVNVPAAGRVLKHNLAANDRPKKNRKRKFLL